MAERLYTVSPQLASSVPIATAKGPQFFTPVSFGLIPAVITILAPKTFDRRLDVSNYIPRSCIVYINTTDFHKRDLGH